VGVYEAEELIPQSYIGQLKFDAPTAGEAYQEMGVGIVVAPAAIPYEFAKTQVGEDIADIVTGEEIDASWERSIEKGESAAGMALYIAALDAVKPHDRTGGYSAGGKNWRADYGRLPSQGKAASRLPAALRGRKLPHYHRRGKGGISRHRPWQRTPGVPWWKFWERF